MANTTPIITIDVNDDAFKAFQASFDKFKKVVDNFSSSFKAVGDAAAKAVDTATSAVEKAAEKSANAKVSAEQRAADKINKINEAKAQKDFQRQLRNLQKMQDAEVKAEQKRLETSKKNLEAANKKRINQEQSEEEKIARQKKDLFKKVLGDNLVSFYDFASKVKDVGMSTVGAALGTAALAIAGFESAGPLAALRKQSGGAGVAAGNFLSFGPSFERFLNDPGSTLQGIANMQLNLAQRGQLQALTGLTGAQVQNRSADQLAPDVLRAIQRRYQENPSLQYAQAFGIDKLVSEDERRRIGTMSKSELESSIISSQQQGAFNRINPDSLKSWTDLYQAIQEASAAGKALMGSMGALADVLGFVTKAFTEAFQVLKFIVDKLSIPFSQWFSSPSKDTPQTNAANVGGQSAGGAPGTGTAADRRNNPGNLRNVGGRGFQQFGSTEEGFRAMAHQLQLYGQRHNDTLQGIISKWAPSSENNTAAYIANVAKKTGFSSTEHLNLNDPTVLSKLMVAMAQQEGTKNKYTPEGVKLMIQNNTGGSAVVSASAMGAS